MATQPQEETLVIHVRIPVSTWKLAVANARNEQRALSNYVAKILTDHVHQKGGES